MNLQTPRHTLHRQRLRITAGAGLGLRWNAALLVVATALSSGAAAQDTSGTGRPGHANVHGIMHFGVLAARDATHAASRGPRAIPAPLPESLPEAELAEAQGLATTAPVGPLAPAGPNSLPPPTPASSFLGLRDNNTSIPPDTNGAVSPTHLMVPLNSQVRVQTRAGGNVSTVSLDTFWSGVPGAYDVFDPRVVYDPFASRWIMISAANRRASDSSIVIAVSQTDNPTGIWNEYLVDGDATDATWVDYPTVGFNKDWIVVQANMFSMSGTTDNFVRSHIFVFDKADLYAGGNGAFTLLQSGSFTVAPAVTADNTLATLYLLTTLAPGHGSLQLFSVAGPVGAEFLGPGITVSSPANTWFPIAGGDIGPQLGSMQGIDLGDHRIRNVVYRNGFIWATHMVILTNPTTHTAVQWWQIAPNGTVIQIGRIDDSAGNRFFAYPSLAVNARNDVLIGYSSFEASQYASASYSFRASTDPPNTLRDEVILKPGELSYYKTYGGDHNRWGDYSATVVDPVNDSDMWTIQEYARSPADEWSTWWGRIVPPCGNGTVDAGEECDDGNTVNADGCDINCTFTACGNGVVTPASGEQCDDGNTVSGDGCDANCIPTCGNGALDPGEQCDDGNTVSGDGCDANCTPTQCGNGAVSPTTGEECDDGNTANGDGCDSHCRFTGCGNGVVSFYEECDDGNQLGGDLCPATCRYSNSGLLIRGTRRNPARPSRSCQVEWYVVNPTNPPDRFGLPSNRQVCLDQDPSCDVNPQPGDCGFQVVACVNTSDVNLSDCTPGGVAQISVQRPDPSRTRLPALAAALAADRAAIDNALRHLRNPSNPDAGYVYAPPLTAGNQNLCSAPFTVTLPTLGLSQRHMSIQTRSVAAAGSTRRTLSTVRLTCRTP